MALQRIRGLLSVESVDFTATKPFALGLVQTGLWAAGFASVFALVAVFRLATLEPEPSSVILAVFVGIAPSLAFGAGVPLLVQFWDPVERLFHSPAVRVVHLCVVFGTYAALFSYHPVVSGLFAATYLASRVTVLVGIYGGSRLIGALP